MFTFPFLMMKFKIMSRKNIIVNFIIQKLKNKHISLKKIYKLSNAKSCDSEFRIFFLNHKFWALESTYSFMLKYSEITGRIFVYFSDQRPQKMLRNLLLLLFLTTCIMMVTSEDVQEEVKKSRNPIDYYTMS